jgi:hypothetical protein
LWGVGQAWRRPWALASFSRSQYSQSLDFETGDIARVSPGIGKTTCSFFRPGSDEVLFSSTHLDPESVAKQKAELEFRASGQQRRYSWDYDEHMDIFSARRDGSNVRQLTTAPGYDAEASFSPDGKRILWRRFSEKSDTADIFTMNLDGSGVRRLTDFGAMSWAPYFHPTLVMSSSQRTSWGSPINGRRSLHDYECA